MAKTHSVVSRRVEQLRVPRCTSNKDTLMPLLDYLTLYVLAGLWTLLALPARWFRRIVQIALGGHET